jgi:hypothetical protein
MKLKRVIVLSLLLLFSVGGLALGGETLARDLDSRDSRDRVEAAGNPNPAQFRRRHRRRQQRRERRRHRRHRRHNM